MSNKVIYIMGVSGCGKTTIGQLLSEETGIPFYDGDDFHPKENIHKMKSGEALEDEDRWPWLEAINKFAQENVTNHSVIIACSALKESYRTVLENKLNEKCIWVHLQSEYDTIASRLKKRTSHFMPLSLLASQFETLEPPEEALTIVNKTTDEALQQIFATLPKKEFGFVGLGVMGKSLSRNLANNEVSLSLYNRHVAVSEEKVAQRFVQQYPELSSAYGFDDISRLTKSLVTPRKIFLMVPAGNATDAIIEELLPHLEAGDILIDGGNSHFEDTQRRQAALAQNNISWIGAGVSGGEAGALKGPAIMPSGDAAAYKNVQAYLERIAAQDMSGKPCCSYVGKGGAGHFVKMVHNGIEYGEMQLLAEVYAILRNGMQYSPDQIADVLEQWNKTDVASYLLEITTDILRRKEGNGWLFDFILDKAGNKGTGNWTSVAASKLGVPIPTITAALLARFNSAYKDDRVKTEKLYAVPYQRVDINLEELQQAYRMARIMNHYEGLQLISTASDDANWDINLAEVARIWTNGCIIRSAFMQQLTNVLQEENNLLWHNDIKNVLLESHAALRNIVSGTIQSNIPIPCFSAALQHFQVCIQGQSSANIIQAQRDYFGAHTYRRTDRPLDESFHTEWEK